MGKSAGKNKLSGVLWLLVLIVVVVAWIYFRPAAQTGQHATVDDASLLDADLDDILVDFRDDVSTETVAKVGSDLGIRLELVSSQSLDERFYRAHVDPALQAELIERLSHHPDVELVERDSVATASPLPISGPAPHEEDPWKDFPNDPKYAFQWHMDQIKMPAAWRLSDGDGVIVAVLDTGVAFENHGKYQLVPDLEGVEFVKPFDFVKNNKHANDGHGHGTHVTGTIAQVTHNGIGVAGVARKVKIMPLKVLGDNGSGSVGGIADAIRYAADEGAHVINMSLGSRFPSKALEKAVMYAHKKGTVVVAAAGNDGRGKVGYPAASPGAVAVAATQYDEKTTFYSNYGKHLDIAAPGGNTRVDQNGDGEPDGVLQNTIKIGDPTQNDYYGYMGTSMASPHAAAVAALVVGEGVTQPAAVEKILKDTAYKPKKKYDKKKYGAGIIDAEAAVLKARGETGGWQFLLGALMAGAVAFGMRRRGLGDLKLGAGYAAGVVVGAGGLFFLPYLAGGLSSWPVVEALTRGLPSWDLSILGASGHGNALFFSALIPLGLVGLLSGVKWLRPALAGLAIGIAAHLLLHSVAGLIDIRWMVLDALWLAANAAVCVGLAYTVLRR